ncbi:hypothetical protein [Corynebacterium sp.]|uniref:hypothetical protein n=1 Tax=Corynebacterium sp. TaxID=1720 RepID=UPI0026DD9472|nr:hypothetical protein [Corynebacterium sp.]MDO5032608.1 hypothetical protein [Corynebacterium sp.]
MTFARTTALASAALVLGLTAPAASADMVDDYLAKVPAGQISCEQASKYYTNASDYNSKKSQALAAANFHPRGAEIRDAIARADEAIARCNLNGQPAPSPQPAPAPAPAPAPKPAPAPAENSRVIPVFSQPGQPTIDVAVPGTDIVLRVPNVQELINAALAQFQDQLAGLSSK